MELLVELFLSQTLMVEKDTYFSVSNCDICALAKSKQQNHPKVARMEVTQPLELVYTDLPRPISQHLEQAIAIWPNSLTTTRP